jgi:hypothetical protein
MLAFTDEQLVTIQTIASPLPLGLRGEARRLVTRARDHSWFAPGSGRCVA